MIQIQAKITSGKLVLDKNQLLLLLKNEKNGDYLLSIKKAGNKIRSIVQNNYYWGVVLSTIADALGYTKDDLQSLHEQFKMMFLKENDGINGLYKIRSTSDLNTLEMEEYLEKIRQFASIHLSIFISLPNETEI